MTKVKPFYKQFLKIRKNVQNQPKLLKFKKLKWRKLQDQLRRKLRFYKRFKLYDQSVLTVTRFASKGNSLQKNYKTNLYSRKTFNLFYGKLKKSYLKTHINLLKTKKTFSFNFKTLKYEIFKFFESRLDTVIYRSKFSLSIKNARQLIKHGHFLINGSVVRTESYILKTNDLVEVINKKKSKDLIKKNIDRSNLWPIPPKHLIINYSTCQIIFLYDKEKDFEFLQFEHSLNIDALIKLY